MLNLSQNRSIGRQEFTLNDQPTVHVICNLQCFCLSNKTNKKKQLQSAAGRDGTYSEQLPSSVVNQLQADSSAYVSRRTGSAAVVNFSAHETLMTWRCGGVVVFVASLACVFSTDDSSVDRIMKYHVWHTWRAEVTRNWLDDVRHGDGNSVSLLHWYTVHRAEWSICIV